MDLLVKLGFKLNLEKNVLEPTQSITFPNRCRGTTTRLHYCLQCLFPSYDYVLTTDASESGAGATLKKGNKTIKTLSFQWSTTQSNMSSNRREMLALLMAYQALWWSDTGPISSATYLRASKGRRKHHSGDSVFIQNEGKPLEVKDINIIVLSTLSSSGIGISKFKSHSTRSAMASLLMSNNVPFHVVKKMGRWKSNDTVDTFYDKRIIGEKSGGFLNTVVQIS
ncbi:hypothetical protein ACTFIR_003793 [Dictyostelium discoideum]